MVEQLLWDKHRITVMRRSFAELFAEVESLYEGRMLLLAPKLAKAQGLDNGFRTMINTGAGGGQEVFHLHIHVFGGGANLPKT